MTLLVILIAWQCLHFFDEWTDADTFLMSAGLLVLIFKCWVMLRKKRA